MSRRSTTLDLTMYPPISKRAVARFNSKNQSQYALDRIQHKDSKPQELFSKVQRSPKFQSNCHGCREMICRLDCHHCTPPPTISHRVKCSASQKGSVTHLTSTASHLCGSEPPLLLIVSDASLFYPTGHIFVSMVFKTKRSQELALLLIQDTATA